MAGLDIRGLFLTKVLGNSTSPKRFAGSLFGGKEPLKSRARPQQEFHIAGIPLKNDWGCVEFVIRKRNKSFLGLTELQEEACISYLQKKKRRRIYWADVLNFRE